MEDGLKLIFVLDNEINYLGRIWKRGREKWRRGEREWWIEGGGGNGGRREGGKEGEIKVGVYNSRLFYYIYKLRWSCSLRWILDKIYVVSMFGFERK